MSRAESANRCEPIKDTCKNQTRLIKTRHSRRQATGHYRFRTLKKSCRTPLNIIQCLPSRASRNSFMTYHHLIDPAFRLPHTTRLCQLARQYPQVPLSISVTIPTAFCVGGWICFALRAWGWVRGGKSSASIRLSSKRIIASVSRVDILEEVLGALLAVSSPGRSGAAHEY